MYNNFRHLTIPSYKSKLTAISNNKTFKRFNLSKILDRVDN